jgi:hypothetical protein
MLTRREAIEKIYSEQLEALIRCEVDLKLFEEQISDNDPFKRTKEEVAQLTGIIEDTKRKIYAKQIVVKTLENMLKAEAKVGD